MTIYVGGLRRRLIKDNLRNDVQACLDALGWFDAGRNHRSVTVKAEQLDPRVEILPNRVNVTVEDSRPFEMEMGSGLEENHLISFIDIFAESEAIGEHLTGDIFDLLRGKFTSIKEDAVLPVYDLTMATPTWLFNCYYEDFEQNRTREWDKPANQFWWTIAFDILDYYTDESG